MGALEAYPLPCLQRTDIQNSPQARSLDSGKHGGLQCWVTMFPFPGDLPAVPVFDRTVPVKQMHVLEALDLLILRADRGAAPLQAVLPSRRCSLLGAVLQEEGEHEALCGQRRGSQGLTA